MDHKSKFDVTYNIWLSIFTLVFLLTALLSREFGLNISLLVANLLSIILTLLIWRKDGILRLDIKTKYSMYYLFLLLFFITLYPKDISSVTNILYKNGFREEVLYRFFMVGIFLKYFYSDNEESQKKFLYAIFTLTSFSRWVTLTTLLG